jgi:RND family efflux transporter MFP subunit
VNDLKQQLEALRLDNDRPRPGRWRYAAAGLALILVAAGILAWRSRDTLAAPEVEAIVPTTEQARAGSGATPILAASGYVVARRKAVVSAKIQGRLAELRVEEGSRVRQGEVIARLESADFEAQVLRARARVASAQAQVARTEAAIARAEADLAEARRQAALAERLAAERVASTDERDAAKSRVAIAEAALRQATAERDQARADLRQADADVHLYEALYQNTLIRAPFAGTVVKKMAEVGESVAPIPPGVNISTASGAVVALADLDTLEVEVDVSESNVARLAPEQPAEVVVEAFPDRTYRGRLRQVIPTADRTKATVMVKVTILDKDEKLKPEMSAKVTFLEAETAAAGAPARPVVVVPQEAVVTRDGATQVFEVTGDRVRLRPVRVGLARQNQVVVTDGLTGSERLVLRPPQDLRDGDPVRVRTGRP